ncbi:MAG: Transmembrane component BioN of energizing module of biotin ECF transporter, partial [uncultured Nocardioides sp.]
EQPGSSARRLPTGAHAAAPADCGHQAAGADGGGDHGGAGARTGVGGRLPRARCSRPRISSCRTADDGPRPPRPTGDDTAARRLARVAERLVAGGGGGVRPAGSRPARDRTHRHHCCRRAHRHAGPGPRTPSALRRGPRAGGTGVRADAARHPQDARRRSGDPRCGPGARARTGPARTAHTAGDPRRGAGTRHGSGTAGTGHRRPGRL